jgi:hypothetical protein
MADFYFKHEHNPNDSLGGGGCLASSRGQAHEDCRGPWYNFPYVQTEYALSPFAVICEYHLQRLIDTREDEEALTEGDPLPLRQYTPVTREDTGLPAFEGVAGAPVNIR